MIPGQGQISFNTSSPGMQQWTKDGGGFIQTATSDPTYTGMFARFGTSTAFVNNLLTIAPGSTRIGIFTNKLRVDAGLNSGDSLSGSATVSGSFASLGITEGTSWTEFTLIGQANRLEFVAGDPTVPEPSTAIAMGLLGIVGFAGNRRRRRQESVA